MSQFSSRSSTVEAVAAGVALFGLVYATLFLGQFLLGIAVVLFVVLCYFLWRLVVTGEAIVQALRDSGQRRGEV